MRPARPAHPRIDQFIAETCTGPHAWQSAASIYARFKAWGGNDAKAQYGRNNFNTALVEMGFACERKSQTRFLFPQEKVA